VSEVLRAEEQVRDLDIAFEHFQREDNLPRLPMLLMHSLPSRVCV